MNISGILLYFVSVACCCGLCVPNMITTKANAKENLGEFICVSTTKVNSLSLARNSVSSLSRNSSLETAFRPFLRKVPAPIKTKSALPPPPPNPKPKTPPKRGILWTWRFSCRKNTEILGAHEMAQLHAVYLYLIYRCALALLWALHLGLANHASASGSAVCCLEWNWHSHFWPQNCGQEFYGHDQKPG